MVTYTGTFSALQKTPDDYKGEVVMHGGRIRTMIYYTVCNDDLNARIKVSALKGKLARAVPALQLASGLYEIPKSGRSPSTAP